MSLSPLLTVRYFSRIKICRFIGKRGGICIYPYHNRIKQRIRAGELISYSYRDDYPGIGRALVLVFRTEPFLRPIRPERFEEYMPLLSAWESERQQ